MITLVVISSGDDAPVQAPSVTVVDHRITARQHAVMRRVMISGGHEPDETKPAEARNCLFV